MKPEKEITLRSSELNRRYLCPGSMKAEDGLAEPAGRDMSAAEAGTAAHTYMEQWLRGVMSCMDLDLPGNPLPAIVTGDELNIEIMSGRVQRILLEYGMPEAMYLEKPLRVAHPPGDGRWIVLGRADVVFAYPDKVIVIDYKSGWSDALHAIDNLQLHSYLLGAMTELNRMEGLGFILSPLSTTRVRIEGAGEILDTSSFLQSIWEECHEDEAQLIPGSEQCQYCKALGTFRCPETKNMSLPAVKLRDDLDQYGGVEWAAKSLSLWKMHEKVADRLKGLIKAALVEGIDIPGWELGKPRNIRTIPDAATAFNKLQEKGLIDVNEFAGCCTVGLTALEARIKDRTGSTKKGATKMMEETLGDSILRSESAPPLKQSKAGL